MEQDAFDVVVVGAGVAGMQAAFKAVYRGKRTALIEKERLGGTCLTRGCIPTKAMVRSAEVAHLARRGDEFGVRIPEVEVDWPAVVARKDRIVDSIESVNEEEVAETEDLELIRGQARFLDPHTLEVGERTITGELFILATGARPLIPDWPGIDEVDFLTSRDFLDLERRPDHLIVIGGGYIGLECAQIMARAGAEVTLLQRSEIIKQEDPEIIDRLTVLLEDEGVGIVTGATVERLEQEGDTRIVHVDLNGKPDTFQGDQLLLAIGRTPNGDTLDLGAAGVETWGPGWVKTDGHMRTSQPHILAVGDANGEWLFTHVARYEVEVAIANALDGQDVEVDYWAAPYAVFTDPELGRVGLTLQQARERGLEAEEVTFTFEHLGKALCLGEEEGMIKVVAEQGSGRLLGMHVLGAHGGELVHEAVLVMHRKGTVDDLADAIHIHPTMAEGVNDAAFEMAIHLGRRRF